MERRRSAGEDLVAQLRDLGLERSCGSLDDSDLRQRAVGLRRLIDRLEGAFAEVAHALDARQVPACDGEFDAAGWLAGRAGMSRSRGRAAARLGAGLAGSSELGPAVSAGAVSPEAATMVLGVRNSRTEAAWVRDEAMLVGLAARHRPDDLRRLLARWSAGADPDGADPGADPERNTLTLATVGGRGMLRGDLDAESTALVAAALADVHDELWRAAADEGRYNRSAARWRAEALVELVRRGRGADPATSRAARPLVTVVIDSDALVQLRGRVAELPTGALVPAEAVRRMACDAVVAGVVMGRGGEPLAAGRTRRLPSAAQARAVLARDRGCGLSNCHSPPWLCEIHHIRHWADGGSTDIDNLLMLCRRHHRFVHERGMRVERLPGGGFELRPPHALTQPAA